MATQTGLGWGLSAAFGLASHRFIYGASWRVMPLSSQLGLSTLRLATLFDYPAHFARDVINYRTFFTVPVSGGLEMQFWVLQQFRSGIGGPLPGGTQETPQTEGQLWPRY